MNVFAGNSPTQILILMENMGLRNLLKKARETLRQDKKSSGLTQVVPVNTYWRRRDDARPMSIRSRMD